MKLTLDPMPALRADAVIKVNDHFARVAGATMHQEPAWQRKREVAQRVLHEGVAAAPDAFAQEAALRGVGTTALAEMIMTKPDPTQLADARELRRQRALLAIDATTTPAAIETILNSLGDA